MDSKEFIQLVANMRHAQKSYFRTHSSSALEDSKRAERAVDDALQSMNDKQPRLFEDES
jgi:hypothetical protein